MKINFASIALVSPQVDRIVLERIGAVDAVWFRTFGKDGLEVHAKLCLQKQEVATIIFKLVDLNTAPTEAWLMTGGKADIIVFNEDSEGVSWLHKSKSANS